MSWFEAEFGKWVVKYRWWIIAVTLIVVLVASSGTRFLTINNDIRVFFREENPQLRALEALENTYDRIDQRFVRDCSHKRKGLYPVLKLW